VVPSNLAKGQIDLHDLALFHLDRFSIVHPGQHQVARIGATSRAAWLGQPSTVGWFALTVAVAPPSCRGGWD